MFRARKRHEHPAKPLTLNRALNLFHLLLAGPVAGAEMAQSGSSGSVHQPPASGPTPASPLRTASGSTLSGPIPLPKPLPRGQPGRPPQPVQAMSLPAPVALSPRVILTSVPTKQCYFPMRLHLGLVSACALYRRGKYSHIGPPSNSGGVATDTAAISVSEVRMPDTRGRCRAIFADKRRVETRHPESAVCHRFTLNPKR